MVEQASAGFQCFIKYFVQQLCICGLLQTNVRTESFLNPKIAMDPFSEAS